MLLQDTAQAGPEIVPFANASACLHAYRSGMSRPRGGMRALVEGIGRRFAELGGDLRTATLVDRVEAVDPPVGRAVSSCVTRRRDRLRARQVAFNLPLDLAARLLDRPLSGLLAAGRAEVAGRLERVHRPTWRSPATPYPTTPPCSTRSCSPTTVRSTTGTMCWSRFHRSRTKATARPTSASRPSPPTPARPTGTGSTPTPIAQEGRLRRRASSPRWPGPSPMRRRRWSTPNSPRRGASADTPGARPVPSAGPRSRGRNSNFLAVGPDVLGPGLWVVGDSVFPGQGTMATVLSAIRVVERITGIAWTWVRAGPTGSR